MLPKSPEQRLSWVALLASFEAHRRDQARIQRELARVTQEAIDTVTQSRQLLADADERFPWAARKRTRISALQGTALDHF